MADNLVVAIDAFKQVSRKNKANHLCKSTASCFGRQFPSDQRTNRRILNRFFDRMIFCNTGTIR